MNEWLMTQGIDTPQLGLVLGLMTGLLLASSQAQESKSAEVPKVGDMAPDWEMVGSDGKTYKLSDYKGKQAVVVAWYPKAMTGG